MRASSGSPIEPPEATRSWALEVPSADSQLVERVLSESGVAREVPDPEWIAYLGELLSRLLGRLFGGVHLDGLVSERGVVLFAWLLVAALSTWIVHLLLERRRPNEAAPHDESPAWRRVASPSQGEPIDWSARFRELLGRGELRPALEALWWELVAALAPRRGRSSWSARDLLARVDDRDLRPALRTLDRLRFRADEPRPDEIEELTRQLRSWR